MKNFLINLLLIPIFSFSQDVFLDENFGEGGIVVSDPPIVDDLLFQEVKEILLNHSGDIYTIGEYQYGEDYYERSKIVISKFSEAGAKDVSFGDNGILTLNLPFEFSALGSAFLTDDQKIIGVGYNNYFIDNSQMFLFKLNLDGTLDTQFGHNGVLIFSELGLKGISITTDENSNLYIAGNISDPPYNWDYIIMKINSQGEVVNSFGDGGRLIFDFGGFDSNPKIISKGDKLYFAGDSNVHELSSYYNNYLILIRLNLDGELDNSFGNQGIVQLEKDWGGFRSSSIAVNEFEEIYSVGSSTQFKELFDVYLLKFRANGELDTEFGANGMVVTDFFGENDWGYNVHLSDNNTSFLSGFVGKQNDSDFLLMKYDPDGSLDVNFGESGIILTDIGNDSSETCKASFMIEDTHIILAGTSELYLAMAKYKLNPRMEVDEYLNESIIIAPNPTSNSFVINGLNGNQNQVQVIDLTGKIIQEFQSVQNNQTLNLGSIPKGNYIINIQSKDKIESKKLVVK